VRANSLLIESSQSGPHRRLLEVVERHRRHAWQQPIAAHSRAAFAQLRAWLHARAALPLVLDSGCGTGASTIGLAAAYPDCSIVGIDQSLARLSRHGQFSGDMAVIGANAALLRAPLQDLWRLMLADGIRLRQHFLWYPNPWPKPEHLGRRWHAHPVFPDLLALGGEIELRSNWRIYVDEFALALGVHGRSCAMDRIADTTEQQTAFERKYRDSGHAIWRLVAAPIAPEVRCGATSNLPGSTATK
jgi:tRNA G46 methylase TrmB